MKQVKEKINRKNYLCLAWRVEATTPSLTPSLDLNASKYYKVPLQRNSL